MLVDVVWMDAAVYLSVALYDLMVAYHFMVRKPYFFGKKHEAASHAHKKSR